MDYATVKSFEAVAKNAAENRRQEKRKKHAEELKIFDVSQLTKMPPAILATWQSEFEQDEPQWVLADQEWKRRSGISTRRIAIVAILVSVLSLIIATLSYLNAIAAAKLAPEKSVGQPTTKPQLPAKSQQAGRVYSSQTNQAVNPTNLTGIHE